MKNTCSHCNLRNFVGTSNDWSSEDPEFIGTGDLKFVSFREIVGPTTVSRLSNSMASCGSIYKSCRGLRASSLL